MDKPVPLEAKEAIQRFMEEKLREALETGIFHPCIPDNLRQAILRRRAENQPDLAATGNKGETT